MKPAEPARTSPSGTDPTGPDGRILMHTDCDLCYLSDGTYYCLTHDEVAPDESVRPSKEVTAWDDHIWATS